MAARIARLYAHNYRSFVNFELRPGRRSLLLGYNGSGKSSVFDVFDALRRIVLQNAEVAGAFPSSTVAKFGDSDEQRFELDVEDDTGMLHYRLLVQHDPAAETVAISREELQSGDELVYRFTNGAVQIYGDGSGPAKEPFPISPQRSFLASVDPKARNSPIVRFKHFLGVAGHLRIDPGRIGAAAWTEDDSLEVSASNFASYCRYLLQARPDWMQRAYEVLGEVIPGFQHLRMQAAGRAKVLVATFRYPGGRTYDLDFDALSDGQKTLTVLYVALQSAARHLSALCLDEPDNFVSLREIQPFLTELADVSDETGLQVMLISHSPEVIDYVGPSDAILFERPDGGHTRVRTVEAKGPLRLSELMARGWLPGGPDGSI